MLATAAVRCHPLDDRQLLDPASPAPVLILDDEMGLPGDAGTLTSYGHEAGTTAFRADTADPRAIVISPLTCTFVGRAPQ
ncbi:MAG: hypothetical protein NVS3B26_31060 [Mycobacteriales bacterium]